MNRYLFVSLTLLVLFTDLVIASGKVVLVGSGAPDPIDAPLIEHLEKWGFTVEPHEHLEKQPVKLDGVDLNRPVVRISWALTRILLFRWSMQKPILTMTWDSRQMELLTTLLAIPLKS